MEIQGIDHHGIIGPQPLLGRCPINLNNHNGWDIAYDMIEQPDNDLLEPEPIPRLVSVGIATSAGLVAICCCSSSLATRCDVSNRISSRSDQSSLGFPWSMRPRRDGKNGDPIDVVVIVVLICYLPPIGNSVFPLSHF